MALGKFIFVEDRAQMEGRTVGAIYAERHRGEGPPAVRLGRKLAWREADYVAWLESRVEKQPA